MLKIYGDNVCYKFIEAQIINTLCSPSKRVCSESYRETYLQKLDFYEQKGARQKIANTLAKHNRGKSFLLQIYKS